MSTQQRHVWDCTIDPECLPCPEHGKNLVRWWSAPEDPHHWCAAQECYWVDRPTGGDA